MSINAAPLPTLVPHFGDLAAWAQSTFYALGQRVVANGNVYECVEQGTSSNAGAGPAGAGAGIVDGTAKWDFVIAVSAAWAATTGYTEGDVVTNGGNTYQCIVAGTSAGAGGPSGTGGFIVDNTAVWSFLSATVAAQTMPTARTGDMGQVTGAPFIGPYDNWWKSSVLPWLYYLRDFLNSAHTWTEAQTINSTLHVTGVATFDSLIQVLGGLLASSGVELDGAGDDDDACLDLGAAAPPTDRKLLISTFPVENSGMCIRFYQKANVTGITRRQLEITWNAYWDAGGAQWTADNDAFGRIKLSLSLFGLRIDRLPGAFGATWADSAWERLFWTEGTPYADGDLVISGGWGAASVTANVVATDEGGSGQILTNGGGEGANPTITVTFVDGTFGSRTPAMIFYILDATNDVVKPCRWVATSTGFVVTYIGTPFDGVTYELRWILR